MEEEKLKRICCEVKRLAIEHVVDISMFRPETPYQIETYTREASKKLVIRLAGYLAGRKNLQLTTSRTKRTINVPESWWDAFKMRWFPGWALALWPPRMRAIACKVINQETWMICPHLPVDPRLEHVQFLMKEDNAT